MPVKMMRLNTYDAKLIYDENLAIFNHNIKMPYMISFFKNDVEISPLPFMSMYDDKTLIYDVDITKNIDYAIIRYVVPDEDVNFDKKFLDELTKLANKHPWYNYAEVRDFVAFCVNQKKFENDW